MRDRASEGPDIDCVNETRIPYVTLAPRLEGVVKMLIILRFDFEDHRITKQVVFEPESRAVSVDFQPVLDKSRGFGFRVYLGFKARTPYHTKPINFGNIK